MKLVDFHAHIIPWADHGSSSIETTISQLNLAMEAEIDTIVATPHFYPQYENAERFIERRNACYDRLKEQLNEHYPRIILGAEVLICDNIESMPGLDALCLGDSRIILLELPFTDFSDSYVYSVRMLIKQGYTVVLAHADRYDPDNINRLVSAGAKIQLNADSLSKLFVQPHLREWASRNKVVALGSDIHGADPKAYKRFKKALKRLEDHTEQVMSSSIELLNLD
jgi:protein-tyrosine phosphatase